MKKVFLFLSLCLLVVSFTNDAAAQQQKLRIGVAGIQIENSVFMPNRQPIVGRPLTLPDYLSPDSAMGQAATWLPSLMGRGGGRGPVTKESYDAFVNEALEIIKANMPYDAFWFYNHGACSVIRKVSLWKKSAALSATTSLLRPLWTFTAMPPGS